MVDRGTSSTSKMSRFQNIFSMAAPPRIIHPDLVELLSVRSTLGWGRANFVTDV